jgi:hypothetical protein
MKNKLERHLEILGIQRLELIDKHSGKAGFEDIMLKPIDNELEDVKKQLNNVDNMNKISWGGKTIKLPDIPMGKNTHIKTTDGFVHDKTRIKIQPKIKDLLNAPSSIVEMKLAKQVSLIQSSWNDLPDDVRGIVKTLNLKISRAGSYGTAQGGKWDEDKGELILNLHPTRGSVMHHFYHEIGHARWWNIEKKEPEKVRKFEKQVEKFNAPTRYSFSYYGAKDKEYYYQKKYRRERGNDITARDEKVLEQRMKTMSNIYHNEIHSEINAFAMGELKDVNYSGVDSMKGLLNAYKELWDIEQ